MFDLHLSKCMALDLHVADKTSPGIDVLGLKPGFVNTKNAETKAVEISPDECARCALKTAGSLPFTNGHWKHILTEAVLPILIALVRMTNGMRTKVE